MKVNPPIVRLVQFMHPFPVPLVDRMLDIFGINVTMEDFKGRGDSSKNSRNLRNESRMVS